ncbi:MAG: hypothetical protein WC767_03755 [Candidatus Paceibacterota bacterium]
MRGSKPAAGLSGSQPDRIDYQGAGEGVMLVLGLVLTVTMNRVFGGAIPIGMSVLRQMSDHLKVVRHRECPSAAAREQKRECDQNG